MHIYLDKTTGVLKELQSAVIRPDDKEKGKEKNNCGGIERGK